MAYQPISTVEIALNTQGVSSVGFTTPLFISSHRYFKERVRTYSTVDDAASDLPTDSAAYKAVSAFLSSTPSVSSVMIGRREADMDITATADATAASMTFFASDGTDTFSVAINLTGQADGAAIATSIAAAIEGDGDISPLVVATASSNVVSISSASEAYNFWVSNTSKTLSESFTSSETAADVLTAISLEDDDYYFITAEDKTQAFILAMAAEAESRIKIYFTSTNEPASLTPYEEGEATDTGGRLKDLNYFRTVWGHSNVAETSFPECFYIGYNGTYDSGSVTWGLLNLSGVAPTKDSSTGLVLTTTQKGYIEDRNGYYVELKGGLNALRGGKVASGERIDTIRGRDNLSTDLDSSYSSLLLSQQGSKIPFNNSGIATLESVCRSELGRYVTRGFINDNFTVTFPSIDKVSTADRQARIYQQGTFEAELVGAIELVKISGVLTLNL